MNRSRTILLVGLVGVAVVAAFLLSRGSGGSQHIRPVRTVKADDFLMGRITITHDGKRIATSSWRSGSGGVLTGTVSLWNADNWKLLATSVYSSIPEATFTQEDRTLLVSAFGGVEFRDGETGALIRSVKDDQYKSAFEVSPDGRIMALASIYGSTKSNVRLLSTEDGSLIRTIEVNTGEIDDLAFSPDGKLLATPGFEDYSVRLWNVSDGSPVRTMNGHTHWVYSVEFAPDGQTLASVAEDGTMRLWRVSDGQLLQTMKIGAPDDIAFSPDGTLVATGSSYDWVGVWRASDGGKVASLVNEDDNIGSGGKVLSVRFSPDGKTVYGGTDDSTLRVWQLP